MTWEEVDMNHVAEKPESLSEPTSVVYLDAMWMFGGFKSPVYPNLLWKLNFTEMTWEKLLQGQGNPNGRSGHTAVVYEEAMWAFGGWNGHDYMNDLWKLDFPLLQWEEINPATPPPDAPQKRRRHTALVYEEAMWIFGGNSQSENFLNGLWKFSFPNETWSEMNPIHGTQPTARYFHSSVLYEGAMWMFGGSRE